LRTALVFAPDVVIFENTIFAAECEGDHFTGYQVTA
jgi:hypothetical protein